MSGYGWERAYTDLMFGMVHALGHTVGARHHVHHGTCMSILLPHVLEYNLDKRGSEIGQLLLPLAGPERYAATLGPSVPWPRSRR